MCALKSNRSCSWSGCCSWPVSVFIIKPEFGITNCYLLYPQYSCIPTIFFPSFLQDIHTGNSSLCCKYMVHLSIPYKSLCVIFDVSALKATCTEQFNLTKSLFYHFISEIHRHRHRHKHGHTHIRNPYTHYATRYVMQVDRVCMISVF